MRLRHCLYLTCAFLGAPLGGAALKAQSAFSCADWKTWALETRMIYLAGWADGRQSGAFDATKEFAPVVSTRWGTDPRVAALFAPSVSVGQTEKGMGIFCEDSRNLHVGVRSAIEIVFKEASGIHHFTEDEMAAIRRRGPSGEKPRDAPR